MVTIDNAMPFQVLISLMSFQVFSTLQIPISILIPASPVRGLGGNKVETHSSIILPVAFGATEGFQTFLVNFFIVDLMLPYEAIITSTLCQVAQVLAPPHKSSALVPVTGSTTWSPH
jgi:hypothetical protein